MHPIKRRSLVSVMATIGSVALLLMLCKAAHADEVANASDENGFSLGGYSSAGITLPRDGDAKAAINEISLILRWENDSRFKFFSEIELEDPLTWDEQNKLNTKESFVNIERLYLDYNYSEKTNFRAGRFLTPAGRWNLLHAAPLVWTSTRPLATSRLFPITTNGVMAFGAVPLKDSAFEYTIFVEALKDQIDDDDEIKFKHVKGARFTFGQDLNFGLNLLSFTEKTASNPSYRMLGFDFLTHYQDIEFLGEGFQRWDSDNKDGGSGAYLQTAIPLSRLNNWSSLRNWYGIARLEIFDRPDERRQERWLLGATWRIKPTQLLKLEFTGGSGDQPESPRGFLGSFAVLF
ncbi:MAG TPA: hypothetical protein VES38_07795 [Methylotenera sp.]|nr:hypothetical protein [Methylotenera sp.]